MYKLGKKLLTSLFSVGFLLLGSQVYAQGVEKSRYIPRHIPKGVEYNLKRPSENVRQIIVTTYSDEHCGLGVVEGTKIETVLNNGDKITEKDMRSDGRIDERISEKTIYGMKVVEYDGGSVFSPPDGVIDWKTTKKTIKGKEIEDRYSYDSKGYLEDHSRTIETLVDGAKIIEKDYDADGKIDFKSKVVEKVIYEPNTSYDDTREFWDKAPDFYWVIERKLIEEDWHIDGTIDKRTYITTLDNRITITEIDENASLFGKKCDGKIDYIKTETRWPNGVVETEIDVNGDGTINFKLDEQITKINIQ